MILKKNVYSKNNLNNLTVYFLWFNEICTTLYYNNYIFHKLQHFIYSKIVLTDDLNKEIKLGKLKEVKEINGQMFYNFIYWKLIKYG